MNENDSREAHEQRDKDVDQIAKNTVKSNGLFRHMLGMAWESGFDYRATDAAIATAAREYVAALDAVLDGTPEEMTASVVELGLARERLDAVVKGGKP